jgi:hypothetical protein
LLGARTRYISPRIAAIGMLSLYLPTTITADAGYWDTTSLLDPAVSGIEMLVAPDSKPQLPGSPLPPNAPRSLEAFRMREILATQEGKARYALRQTTVEPVFGQIKEVRGIRGR